MASGFRGNYGEHGVDGYYRSHGQDYRNPHEPVVRHLIQHSFEHWHLSPSSVLDLACGSGEVTLALRQIGVHQLEAMDPFTTQAYLARTGSQAEPISFEDIEAGKLADRSYDLIICSFALHLAVISRLPLLLFQLSRISPLLMVITPHKRPLINPAWNWILADELQHQRVRSRLYRYSLADGIS
jgi:2-polyprenyl-3-methyl-5-hydroxy-6-metoxy-1,4-benzoquinol methylase